MGLMDGKRGVIFGVANDKSIAWGVAQQLHAAGAELALRGDKRTCHSPVASTFAACVSSPRITDTSAPGLARPQTGISNSACSTI